jgi:hypothetical protein
MPSSGWRPSAGLPPGASSTSTTNKRVLEGLALAEKFRLMEENQP